MARTNKFDYEALVESELISAPEGLSLDELLERCGVNVNRSTLFRHLARLIESGRVERVGNARASRYRLITVTQSPDAAGAPSAPRSAAPNVVQITERRPMQETQHPATGEIRLAPPSGDVEPKAAPIPVPDHGMVVKKAVRMVVREWKRCNEVNLGIYLSLMVKPEQVEELAAVVKAELAGLQEGNLDAYGLTPAEFSRYLAHESSRAGSA